MPVSCKFNLHLLLLLLAVCVCYVRHVCIGSLCVIDEIVQVCFYILQGIM